MLDKYIAIKKLQLTSIQEKAILEPFGDPWNEPEAGRRPNAAIGYTPFRIDHAPVSLVCLMSVQVGKAMTMPTGKACWVAAVYIRVPNNGEMSNVVFAIAPRKIKRRAKAFLYQLMQNIGDKSTDTITEQEFCVICKRTCTDAERRFVIEPHIAQP